MPVIGVDVGTFSSYVGAVLNGSVTFFSSGDRPFVPSVVAFNKAQRLVGQDAADQFVQNPEGTIYHISRLIGRSCTDPWLIANFRKFPFPIVSYDGRVIVKVTYKNQLRYFRPEQFLSMLLIQLKEFSEVQLRQQVTRAVLAVPACFNSHQRLAMLNAAKIAGLNVERLISAPAAVAIAYRAETGIRTEKTLLVFIMGAGSCDISLIRMNDCSFEVLATAGSTQLAGAEFDERLFEHFVRELRSKHSLDLRSYPSLMQELRRTCIKAKTILSVKSRAHVLLQGLPDGTTFAGKISQEEFEEMNDDIFLEVSKLLETVLSESAVEVDQIDDIVLAGGSTWIPRLQDLLSSYFKHKPLNKILSPEEAVCMGTCIFASTLDETRSMASTIRGLETIYLSEVNPLPLKLLVKGDLLCNLIPRNEALPVELIKQYTTTVYGQNCLSISLVQSDVTGDSVENIFLSGISAASAGLPQIVVHFKVDVNGILRLKVYEQLGHKRFPLQVTSDFHDLTQAEIAHIVKELDRLQQEDQRNLENVAAREALRRYILKHKQQFVNGTSAKAKHLLFHDKCMDALKWIEDNPGAEKIRYEQKRTELDVFLELMDSDQ